MADDTPERRIEFLTARQLADHLQVSESTVHRLRRSGRIPAVYVTDRLARYNLKDVRRALAKSSNHGAGADAAASDDDRQLGFADVFEGFDDNGS